MLQFWLHSMLPNYGDKGFGHRKAPQGDITFLCKDIEKLQNAQRQFTKRLHRLRNCSYMLTESVF
jgi:hypothetical protein